ncbi:MAG: histidine kinase [Bacteroidota bacterium]
MIIPQNNSVAFKVAIHILVWLILCIMPYLLSFHDAPEFTRILKYSWVPMVFYAFVFYANYFVLTEKLLFNKKTFIFIIINLALIIICTWIIFEIKHLIDAVYPMPKPINGRTGQVMRPSMKFFIYKDAISMLIPIVVSIAVRVTEKWTRTEIEKKEAERENLTSELQHLKYQLQPHFFFNSLNNIYSLIERSPSMAQEAVHSLAQLMRYMLYESETGKTNLKQEIEFMSQYINLMKLRIPDKVTVNVDFPALEEDHKIAPLLFISLIENAFKHGISATQPSEIYFSISVKENTIRFMAQNTNFPKTEKDKSGSGIGLNNVTKRLQLLYPGNYLFTTNVVDGMFKVVLTIDLNTN